MTKKQCAEERARMNAKLLAFRKEHFKAKVVVLAGDLCQDPGEMELSITNNGYQWTSINLLRSEAEEVIKLLQAGLDRFQKPEEHRVLVLRRYGMRWSLRLETAEGNRSLFVGGRVACIRSAARIAKQEGLDRWYEVKEGRHNFGVLVPVMVKDAK